MAVHSPSLLLARATCQLAAGGIETPAADARMLLCEALGIQPSQLIRVASVHADDEDRFNEMVDRRRAGEPAQFIVGYAWFRGLRVEVGPGVFIPRLETELVAEQAVQEAQRLVMASACPSVVDLCTGTGAIALAVASEVPGSRVSAVEMDEAALTWARRNLCDSGVEILAGDALRVPDDGRRFDVVVTNPPYLRRIDASSIPDEVTGHEPDLALFSGDDGLDLPRQLVGRAAELLTAGGLFIMEHDETQRDELMTAMATSHMWEQIEDHDDLAGRPRFVTARRRCKDGCHG
ncbi:peptide chain release factor N(5)-glutamine methyltransferase [Cutibacterium modestum]|uniref:peptide chain release factor N(5)-glutamine methyltransferase n=1 Tax=Cutibacterium modestum TaxID=2559073 RepID=UPI000F0502C3|nr:peptide chain release factor N(5)-glutamine methyltransferase [Cutibacterium modestum]MCP2378151.1 protein-(glutamine-N5) methyltransferase [Cutibacterium modestum 31N]